MKRSLLTLACFILLAAQTHAQTLIHYWHFNNFTGVYHNPGIPAIKADYSIIDTNKALFVYHLITGASSTYAGYEDFVNPVASGTPDFDSLNLRVINGVPTPSGSAVRFRNPSDSAYITFNIPTTGYKNITLKFAVETSNTSTSPTNQTFAYSTDSGSTWKTTSLSAATDTVTPVFSLITVTFGADSAVNNNPKLIFKVTNTVRLTGNGNVRFDNISVDGTAISTSTGGGTQSLVHYWHFNNFNGAFHNPGIPSLKADWSAIDTNKTALAYKLVAGTSSAYAGYVDYVATGAADSDIYNLRTINGVLTPAGNAYRFRNPTDSAYLLLYIPSTNYKNLTFSYTVESSSTASGYHYNDFSYSTDSGATFKTVGLDKIQDSSISVGSYASASATCVYKLITVNFTSADATVNNNPRLVFKIVPSTINAAGFAPTSNTSGNNRFDNFALDGVKIDTATHVGVPSVISNIDAPVLYPNPAGNNVYINTYAEGQKAVNIYNIAGKKVSTTISSDKILNISTAQFVPGMYFVNINIAGGNVYTMRFVKQ